MLNSEGLEDYHVDLSSVPSIQVVACLVGIMDAALYDSHSKEGVEKLFPADFHPALKGLLADVITTNLPNWREASLKSMVCKANSRFGECMFVYPSCLVVLPKANVRNCSQTMGKHRTT